MKTRRRKKPRKNGTDAVFVSWHMKLLAVIAVCCLAVGAQENPTAPVVPQPGELHIPPSTRVVEGVVKDANGASVANATVLLKDTKTLQIRSYITQHDGSFRLYGLSTDVNYELRAETSNMTSPPKQISVFDSHKVIKVDLKLKNKKKTS
jgi:hypothetical protein